MEDQGPSPEVEEAVEVDVDVVVVVVDAVRELRNSDDETFQLEGQGQSQELQKVVNVGGVADFVREVKELR